MTKLLVAEDEKPLAKALIAILNRGGFEADAVYDGLAALEQWETGLYDALILDVMMPRMDGLTTLRSLREWGCGAPILLLTAKTEVDDRVEGLDCGANDYLTKPFSPRELLARVRAMTREPELESGTVLRLGNVALDRLNNALSSPVGTLNLTNRERDMMAFFMTCPGHIHTAQRLAEKVWGSTEQEKDAVAVYIAYLQSKLKTLQATIQIKNHRNGEYYLANGHDSKTSN